HDGSYGSQCNSGEAAGGTRKRAEDIHKHTLRRRHIRVHKDTDGFTGAHGCEQATREILLAESLIAGAGAVAINKSVERRIIERADNDANGIAVERMRVRSNFPAAQMRRHEQ